MSKRLRRAVVLLGLFIASNAHAIPIGYFPGLDKLIDTADAIVILRVERRLSDYNAPPYYAAHECMIYQSLKGDIPAYETSNSRIHLQLIDPEFAFTTPFAHGSSHLMFLSKKTAKEGQEGYYTLNMKGAYVPLSPLGNEKMPQGDTLEEKVRNVIKGAIAYENQRHEKKQAFLKKMLGEQKAVATENSTKRTTAEKQRIPADFQQLTVRINAMMYRDTLVTISGNGNYSWKLTAANGRTPKDVTLKYFLSPEHLTELNQLLKDTGWLTAPVPKQSMLRDGTEYTLTLERDGKQTTIKCHQGEGDESYKPLFRMIQRISRQEWLYYSAVHDPDGFRNFIQDMKQEVGVLMGKSYSVYAPLLDYQRMVPTFRRTLEKPWGRSTDEIAVAIDLFAYLQDESQFERIAALANDCDSHIRYAVTDAMARFGGERAVEILREMLKSTADRAAWALIQLGDIAVPTLATEIREGVDVHNQTSVRIIRAYIDHWEEIAKPLDKRIIDAVLEAMKGRLEAPVTEVQYHKQFLGLVDTYDETVIEPVSEKNIRDILGELSDVKPGIISNLDRILAKPPEEKPGVIMEISEETEERLIQSQPESGNALLSVIQKSDDPLHEQAVKTFLYLWPYLSPEQKDAYFKASMTAFINCRPEYPQGIEAWIGAEYGIPNGWEGWPSLESVKMSAVSQKYLDGKPYGDPFHYKGGPNVSAGGILVRNLKPGKHTAKIVTKYTITDNDQTYSGQVESCPEEFQIVDNDIVKKLAAPSTPKLKALVEKTFEFRELRDPMNRDSRLGGIANPDDLWEPQSSAWRGGSYDVYSLHAPIYYLAEPLPVDLCFNVEFQVEDTGKVYQGEPIVVPKGESGELGYFSLEDSITFVKENPGFVPVKITLEPSPARAFTDQRIKQYFNGTLISTPLRVKTYWFRYEDAKPWEKDLIRMYEQLQREDTIHKQVYYSIQSMVSLNPYRRLNGVESTESNRKNGRDVSPAVPFLVKIQEGNETDLEKKSAYEAAEILMKLDM